MRPLHTIKYPLPFSPNSIHPYTPLNFDYAILMLLLSSQQLLLLTPLPQLIDSWLNIVSLSIRLRALRSPNVRVRIVHASTHSLVLPILWVWVHVTVRPRAWHTASYLRTHAVPVILTAWTSPSSIAHVWRTLATAIRRLICRWLENLRWSVALRMRRRTRWHLLLPVSSLWWHLATLARQLVRVILPQMSWKRRVVHVLVVLLHLTMHAVVHITHRCHL